MLVGWQEDRRGPQGLCGESPVESSEDLPVQGYGLIGGRGEVLAVGLQDLKHQRVDRQLMIGRTR